MAKKEEQKYYTSSGEEYNPDHYYVFSDGAGNYFESSGRNGYVWESVTNGVPVSINDKGEWYVTPYLEVTPDSIISHMPDWFKKTPEYAEWNSQYKNYLQPGINKDTFNQLNELLKGYGSQGVTRTALRNFSSEYGLTDQGLMDNNFDQFLNVRTEAETGKPASFSVYGKDYESVADFARDFASYSKEDQSKFVTAVNKILNDAKDKKGGLSLEEQQNVMNALIWSDALNYVNNNPKKFGKDSEFEGLLQASIWQKLYSNIEAFNTQILNSPAAIPGRLVHGALSWAKAFIEGDGKVVFDSKLTQYSDYTTDPSAGAGLEGRDAFISVGNFAGGVGNFAITWGMSVLLGGKINGLSSGMAGSAGAAAQKIGTFMQTVPGSMVTDFFLHDIPIDLLNFFTVASENGWDWGKAWNNPEQEQNLIAIPLVGELGPKVEAGLKNDLIGDAIVDFSLPVLAQLNKITTVKVDEATNGAATRFKEFVAVKNLELQEKMTNIPVVGTAWKKFINHFMGAENANFIREARKASIAEGTMDWYRMAQNVLTIKNHGGAEAVSALYEALLKKTGTLDAIQSFQKNAKKYGGISKVQVDWKETRGGETKKFSKTVPDVLPKQVKQGVMDIERLAELKGQQLKDGGGPNGIVKDTAREKEIKTLEARVEKLPQEIKDFADKLSEANKYLSRVGVELGITNEDWLKAMEMDPTFEKYMVRQALVPTDNVNGRVGSAERPAILNKGRKGYYAENYIDPTIALNMKAAALGRAHAWNLQAKTVVAMQKAQGKIIAGKGGVEAAEKLAEVKKKIAQAESIRKAVDYDGALDALSKKSRATVESIREMNTILNEPGRLSRLSVYSAKRDPSVGEFVADFEEGKVSFGDGVKEAAGLSDQDAAFMVQNTYSYVKTDGTVALDTPDNVNGKTIEGKTKGNVYNEGVAPDGTAYRYTVKDGKITDIKEISDPQAMANTINRLAGGIYNIDANTVKTMGAQNARAINLMIMFYQDNMPALSMGATIRADVDPGAFGWIPTPHPDNAAEYGFRLDKDGRIVCDAFPVYLGLPFYRAGQEEDTLSKYRRMEVAGENPKNTSALQYTPIHENGHCYMARLSILELNSEIASGKLKLPKGVTSQQLGEIAFKKFNELHVRLARQAFEQLGVNVKGLSDEAFMKLWKKTAYDDISHYAGSKAYQHETFSEAMSEFWANGDASSRLSVAIVEQMRLEGQKYSMAASPKTVFKQNGLQFDAKWFKGDEWSFPEGVKANKQKAQWLAKKRKENPYINGKGLMTKEEYAKANQWDTFFKKEIESYDPSTKTSSPKQLIKKSGEFLEDMANNSAKRLVENVRKVSGDNGFDENLAMIALGQNKTDSADALDNYIVSRVNDTAEKIASKMDGGATEENLNIARITLYSDAGVKREMSMLLSSLTPDLGADDINLKVDTIFKDQAEGLAAIEALPVDYKDLNQQQKALMTELEQSNSYARAVGKKTDKLLKKAGYKGDVTQVIHYREGGQDVYVVVRDPVTASILKRPDDYANHGTTASSLAYAANSIARMYRLGTTGLNPIALVRNVLRDPLQAWATAGINPLTMNLTPQAFYNSLRQYGLDDATIKMVEQKLITWASSSSMTQEIRRMGGETPGSIGYRTKSEKFHKDFNNKVLGSKIFNALETPMEMWESAFRNQVAQQSFTKAMRRTGGDVDKSLASAMFDASNATTNFSHAVGKFQNVTATIPYLSSAINGTASFWRLFNNDPIGMIGRLTAGFMVPVMAITAWNLGSEERRKAYMNLPEWYRDGHIVLVDVEGNIFSIPIPDEITQFSGTVRRLVECTNEANQYSIPSILAQGAFGFLPVDVDGYFNEDGSLNLSRGTAQLLSGLMPQAVSTIYELAAGEKLYTGQDISDYNTLSKIVNAMGNVFGSFAVNIVNDIGFLCGCSSEIQTGKSTMDTLARDLFGMGFDNAKQQFMQLVGKPSTVNPDTGKETKATGLFAESEKIQKQIEAIDKDIAFAKTDEEKRELEEKRGKLVEDFGQRVANLTNNYMSLFSTTGGLELWQRKKLIQILGMGGAVSSAEEGSYQAANATQSDLDTWSLGRQRYVDLGLPAGATEESLIKNENGNLERSLELQAAVDRFYGAPKQAAQDFKNAIADSNLKDLRESFYEQIQKIYDDADANNTTPDYDQIEKIQAQYLQSVDAVLVPIINQYGQSILNNNDFIDEVRDMVNGMIPSDDWRQSTKNAKRFLSTKEYPTATVDVKKWLKSRYSSGMRDRGIGSDPEVTQQLDSIAADIDAGRMGAARGKIQDLKNGINKSQYYISSQDYQRLAELNNMVK